MNANSNNYRTQANPFDGILRIESEVNPGDRRGISPSVAFLIQQCTTRKEVALVLQDCGYQTHVGGHHVAALVSGMNQSFPVRIALITNPLGNLSDFN